jgi:hypothetical protein
VACNLFQLTIQWYSNVDEAVVTKWKRFVSDWKELLILFAELVLQHFSSKVVGASLVQV